MGELWIGFFVVLAFAVSFLVVFVCKRRGVRRLSLIAGVVAACLVGFTAVSAQWHFEGTLRQLDTTGKTVYELGPKPLVVVGGIQNKEVLALKLKTDSDQDGHYYKVPCYFVREGCEQIIGSIAPFKFFAVTNRDDILFADLRKYARTAMTK